MLAVAAVKISRVDDDRDIEIEIPRFSGDDLGFPAVLKETLEIGNLICEKSFFFLSKNQSK